MPNDSHYEIFFDMMHLFLRANHKHCPLFQLNNKKIEKYLNSIARGLGRD